MGSDGRHKHTEQDLNGLEESPEINLDNEQIISQRNAAKKQSAIKSYGDIANKIFEMGQDQ